MPDQPALFLLGPDEDGWSDQELEQRAIGLVYKPEFEPRLWMPARPRRQFDAIVWSPHQDPTTQLDDGPTRIETLRDPDQPQR